MAQVTSGTIYDFKWDHKRDAALRFISRTADQCVGHGPTAAELDRLLATILYIFGDDLIDVHRNPEKWFHDVPKGLSTELRRLKPSLSDSEFAEITQQLRAELTVAVDQWKLGHPEDPTTGDVLNVLEHVLFRHRVIHNHPKNATPTSLRK